MATADPSVPETPNGAFIQRHPDGRHAVMDQAGRLVGLHNSHQSALRQMGDYYGAPHRPAPAEMGGETAPAEAPQAAAPAQQQSAPPMQDPTGGMNIGAALIHAHPHANPDQLIAFAHQMGQEHGQAQTPLGAFGAGQADGVQGADAGLQGKLQQQGARQDQLQGRMPGAEAMGVPMPLGPLTRRII